MQKQVSAEKPPFTLKVATGVALTIAKRSVRPSIPSIKLTQLTNSNTYSSAGSTQNLPSTQSQIDSQKKINPEIIVEEMLEISSLCDKKPLGDANDKMGLDMPIGQEKKLVIIGGNDPNAHDSFEDDLLDVTISSNGSDSSQVKWLADKKEMTKMRPINFNRPRRIAVTPKPAEQQKAVSISLNGRPAKQLAPVRSYPQRERVSVMKATIPSIPTRRRAFKTPKPNATADDWKKMAYLEKRGNIATVRKTREFWAKVIGMQEDWIRLVSIAPKCTMSQLGFALSCWKIAKHHFTHGFNCFSVEVQKFALIFLSNSVKIYENTVAKGHTQVQEVVTDFIPVLIKKFIRNPSLMNDYSQVWIRSRQAVELIVNHTSGLENLIIIYSGLVDFQSKFLTSWQKFPLKSAPTDQDTDFFIYALNEIDSLSKMANLRVQQLRRATNFNLLF